MAFNKNITSELIYQTLSDEDIFTAYHGNPQLGTNESSKFRRDDHQSCGFYLNGKGRLIYNDIATSEKLDAFSFVAKMFKISYKEALIKVADEFGLTGKPAKFSKIDPEKAAQIREKEEKIIKIIPDEWTVSYVSYWKQFGLSKQDVEEEVIPVKKLFINGKIIPNYSENLRFAYPLIYKGDTLYKIYTPYAGEEDYKWITNIPIYVPFGIFDLPFKSKTIHIVKSVKEKQIFNKFLTDVISLQNESPAALRDKTIEYLKSKYENIYVWTDYDYAGISSAIYFTSKGLTTPLIPQQAAKEGIKDWGEFVTKYGLNVFKLYLIKNKLI